MTDLTQNDAKKQAVLDLLEYSLLFNQTQRKAIVDNIDKLSSEEINGLGKILAVEHKNREKLDKDFMQAFLKDVEKYKQE